VLLTTGATTAGVVLASGLAEAQPDFGTFVVHFPASGPWTGCPGQDMTGLYTDTGRGGPGPLVQWDMSQCHTSCPAISFMCP
jgi:hypothetical protein